MMEVREDEARELAAQIEREAPGTTATVEPEDSHLIAYRIDVHKPNVIKMTIRSVSQWNERKVLLQKYDRGE